ncbi:MAG: bacteriocin fulvocin C-related protein [Flavobacteriaceae bacterium]
MKKFLLLLFITFCFFSCTIKEENNIDVEVINHEKINQVLKIKDFSEQKLAYSLLNKNEKFLLWNDRLKEINNLKLSNNQKNLIKELNMLLNNKHFLDDSNDNVVLKNVLIPKYLKKLKENFTTKQIGIIFYTLIPITPSSVTVETGDDGQGGDNGGAKDCDCNKSSMVSCQWLNTSSCEDKTCKAPTPENQCGFLLMYPCNGSCKKVG